MGRGAITQYIDVAQVVLYVFWVFFAGLIWYLRQEDRREGYPLENAKTGVVGAGGWPYVPDPKTFRLAGGKTVTVPNDIRDNRPLAAKAIAPFPGAPIEPTGNPLGASIGPGSWAERMDKPDMSAHGKPVIVPLRAAHGFSVAEEDPDPRGWDVIGCDYKKGGKVVEIWVDTCEYMARYLEVSTGTRNVLLPITFSLIKPADECVFVNAITGAQFEGAPATASPNQVTLLEEDRICGYYGGGMLYAHPGRAEPLV
jgi:photosynthetic reaction center H subunit